MKTTIYYFTGTGNSLMAARHLSQCLSGEVKLSAISATADSDAVCVDTDALGFVFPVYFGTIPDIVTELIRKLRFQGDPYLFAVATCNAEPLYTIRSLEKSLGNAGKKLSWSLCLDMPGNALVTSDEDIRIRLSQYKEKIAEAAEHITLRHMNRAQPGSNPAAFLQMKLLYWYGKNFYITPGNFYAADNCIGCGRCAQLCPTKNIILNKQKRPQWKNQCTRCLACFHWCPKQAIHSRTNALDRQQYRHPEVSYRDLINQSLEA